jgi:hypothetical protein
VPGDDCDPPSIVSINDIHGYLDDARNALLTLDHHRDYEPVVPADTDATLHWAGEDYVLVFNGDLIDRGPENEAVLSMVGRLIEETPSGRVRVDLGNHEWMIMFPDIGRYRYYSTTLPPEHRRAFLQRIVDGQVGAAFEGHSVTHSHAGASDPIDVSAMNDRLHDAAQDMLDALGGDQDHSVQTELTHEHPRLLGTGAPNVAGPSAGILWMRFGDLPADAPTQVVSHTPHLNPHSKGKVHCQDILLNNRGSPGGQGSFSKRQMNSALFVEIPMGRRYRIVGLSSRCLPGCFEFGTSEYTQKSRRERTPDRGGRIQYDLYTPPWRYRRWRRLVRYAIRDDDQRGRVNSQDPHPHSVDHNLTLRSMKTGLVVDFEGNRISLFHRLHDMLPMY